MALRSNGSGVVGYKLKYRPVYWFNIDIVMFKSEMCHIV